MSEHQNGHTPLILASASPRRVELLAQVGIVPDHILPADVDETPLKDESPRAYAKRVAELKARTIFKDHRGSFILAADTVVAVGRRILGKADDEAHARRYLDLISGRGHKVIGGLCIVAPDGGCHVKAVTTAVDFKRLSKAEIDAYIASDEWRDKAGAYAIQGRAGAFVRQIKGSYSNVVGLALHETVNTLKGLGYHPSGLV